MRSTRASGSTTPTTSYRYEPYWLFDLQLGLASDNVEALFYVDNLFDDDTMKTGGWGPDFGPGIRGRGFPAGLVQLHYFGPLAGASAGWCPADLPVPVAGRPQRLRRLRESIKGIRSKSRPLFLRTTQYN